MQPTTFRLIYADVAHFVIITLKPNSITVKKWLKGIMYPEKDENRLTEIEKYQYNVLRDYYQLDYQLDKNKPNPIVQRRVDSLAKLYPILLSPNYYQSLINKMTEPISISFDTEERSISNLEFNRLVNLINSTGYWKMPYEIQCDNTPHDAARFELEANNGKKYNIVTATVCPRDTSDFTKACQEFVKSARLEKKINLV